MLRLSGAFNFVRNNLTPLFFLIIVAFSVDRHHRYEYSPVKEFGTFYSDVWEYYNYLPEFFYDYNRVPEFNYHVNRRTIGMALLYSPGFFAGHMITKANGGKCDGYGPFYEWALRWWSIIFCLTGLFFLRRLLLEYFSEESTLLTLALVFFGSNLFFYTYSWGEMPHSYLFSLYSLFFFFANCWVNVKRGVDKVIMSLLAGIIVLVRPTGILVLLLPIFFRGSNSNLRSQWEKLFSFSPSTILATLVFLIPFGLQAIIWKNIHGHLFYYSYGEEGFNWLHPHILDFLFSYRKGWLVYTPGMLVFLVGLVCMIARRSANSVFFIIYFLLTVYVLSSWWEWGYGGSFGCRALVESYAFFAFPIAYVFELVWQNRNPIGIRPIVILFLYVVIKINLFQTWQYKYGIIHFSRMTREAYWMVFMKEELTPLEKRRLLEIYDGS